MKVLAKEFFPLRVGFYAAMIGLVFQSIVWQAKVKGWEQVAQEGGYVESLQTWLVGLSGLSLLHLACISKLLRPIYCILALLAFGAVFREFNNEPWYRELFRPTVKVIIGAGILGLLAYIVRQGLRPAIREKICQPSAVLFMLGFALVTLWAQTLAQKELWPSRDVDRLLEESLELAGYCMIVFGIVECYLEHWRRTRENMAPDSSGARAPGKRLESSRLPS